MVNRRTGKPGTRSESRGGGFVYKERTYQDVKKRADRPSGRFDSPFKQNVDTFRPKQGENLVRILPPTWDNHDHFGLTVFAHGYVGPDNSTYLCPKKNLGKPCPICDAAAEAKAAGDADEAKALYPSEKVLYYILDREGDNPDTPVVWLMSAQQDKEITSQAIDRRKESVLFVDHPDKGYDLSFVRTGAGLKTRYTGFKFDRDPSPAHDDQDVQDAIMDQIEQEPLPELLNYYDADYLEKVIMGKAGEKDEDAGDEEERDRGRGRRGREDVDPKGKRYDPDDERPSRARSRAGDDEGEEQEERPSRSSRRGGDDEAEERPSRARSRREETENEDEPSSTRSGRGTTADRGTRRGRPDPDDEQEERPVRASRRGREPDAEEEEETPPARASRRGRDAEEEEEAPRGRTNGRSNGRGRDAEEEDERPSGRATRGRGSTDEEEEETPRARQTSARVRPAGRDREETRRVGSGRTQYDRD